MGRARANVGWVAGIVGFVVSVLCGLGATAVAIVFAVGAPHALPAMPGPAGIAFLVALLFWAWAIVLLRRSVGGLSSLWDASDQRPRFTHRTAGVAVATTACTRALHVNLDEASKDESDQAGATSG